MTIALGILCHDGVVIGTDLEYSQDLLSSPGQKIFWLPRKLDANYFVLMGASHNPDAAKTFVEELDEKLKHQFPNGQATMPDLKKVIKGALKSVWLEHIDVAPKGERGSLAVDAVLALRVGNDFGLFRTNRTMLVEERQWTCHGSGLYFANALMDRVLPQYRSVELASQIATHVISACKNHIQGVGHGSDIHILPDRGLTYSVLNSEQRQIEKTFDNFFSAVRGLLHCADPAQTPDNRIDYHMSMIRMQVEKMRSEQRARVADRAQRGELTN